MECWARGIGPCEGGQSREHYISKGIIESAGVQVRGLPFCSDQFASISTANANAKILCEGHNSRLSPLDEEGKRFREFLLPQNAPDGVVFRVSGPKISRWLAKTYCNFQCMSRKPIADGLREHAFGVPTSRTVQMFYWQPLYREARLITYI